MSGTIPKYYLRFSEEKDLNKIIDFYVNNHHKSVATRTRSVMEELAGNGSVVMIEDAQGNIVAASISYPITVNESGAEKTKWVEVGSTRIAMGGYAGLFNAMIAAQVMRTFMVEPPTERMVAEMADAPVQALARGLGWRPYQNPPSEMVKQSYAILQDKLAEGYENWYQQGVEGLPIIAKFLTDSLQGNIMTNRKTGQQIELCFDKCRFINMFRDEIADIARKDYGNIEKPDMGKSLYKQRQTWLRTLR